MLVVDAETGETLASNDPGRLLSTASLGKIFALIELVARSEVDAGELLDRCWAAQVADSGL